MDPFDQVVQALSKLPRPLVNCATLIVVSELLMITSSLASLEGGGGERAINISKKMYRRSYLSGAVVEVSVVRPPWFETLPAKAMVTLAFHAERGKN